LNSEKYYLEKISRKGAEDCAKATSPGEEIHARAQRDNPFAPLPFFAALRETLFAQYFIIS
jgi:hypothetical protein